MAAANEIPPMRMPGHAIALARACARRERKVTRPTIGNMVAATACDAWIGTFDRDEADLSAVHRQPRPIFDLSPHARVWFVRKNTSEGLTHDGVHAMIYDNGGVWFPLFGWDAAAGEPNVMLLPSLPAPAFGERVVRVLPIFGAGASDTDEKRAAWKAVAWAAGVNTVHVNKYETPPPQTDATGYGWWKGKQRFVREPFTGKMYPHGMVARAFTWETDTAAKRRTYGKAKKPAMANRDRGIEGMKALRANLVDDLLRHKTRWTPTDTRRAREVALVFIRYALYGVLARKNVGSQKAFFGLTDAGGKHMHELLDENMRSSGSWKEVAKPERRPITGAHAMAGVRPDNVYHAIMEHQIDAAGMGASSTASFLGTMVHLAYDTAPVCFGVDDAPSTRALADAIALTRPLSAVCVATAVLAREFAEKNRVPKGAKPGGWTLVAVSRDAAAPNREAHTGFRAYMALADNYVEVGGEAHAIELKTVWKSADLTQDERRRHACQAYVQAQAKDSDFAWLLTARVPYVAHPPHVECGLEKAECPITFGFCPPGWDLDTALPTWNKSVTPSSSPLGKVLEGWHAEHRFMSAFCGDDTGYESSLLDIKDALEPNVGDHTLAGVADLLAVDLPGVSRVHTVVADAQHAGAVPLRFTLRNGTIMPVRDARNPASLTKGLVHRRDRWVGGVVADLFTRGVADTQRVYEEPDA